jgi:DNA mismatch repair protein MutS2
MACLPDLHEWAHRVGRAIDAEGQLLDTASAEIRRIRSAIARSRQHLKERLQTFLSQPDVVQDTYVTERNGRFVIPVRSEKKGSIDGVLHGASSSGATVFLEPLAVVGLNNDLSLLLEQEAIETRRVLADLTRQLRLHRPEFLQIVDTIGKLDFAAARARLSLRQQGVEPELQPAAGRPGLALNQARHPMLIHFLGREHVVPFDLELESQIEILIISGPNTGGKTAALKAIGLLVAMAQAGFHIPAAAGRIPVFARLRADIGDRQSLQENLSTFSSHILRLRTVLEEADRETLVLLDELGTGTDPAQGAAMAVAVLETLRRDGACVIATTHLDRLKAFAAQHDFAENAAVEFDEVSLRPTFRLLLGSSGHSNALDIAGRLGLDPEVVRLARLKMDPRDSAMEDYLRRLRVREEELKLARQRLDAELAKTVEARTTLLREAKEADRKLQEATESRLRELEAEFEKTLRQELSIVKERLDRDRQLQFHFRRAQKLREQFRERSKGREGLQTKEIPGSPLPEPNEEVEILSLGLHGKFVAVERKQAVVEIGGKRVQVPLSDLRVGRTGRVGKPLLPTHVTFVPAGSAGVPRELNLVGRTVDEALPQIDKFLDQAFLENYDSVRLIHGRGSGRLAKAIREFLVGHPHVATAGQAPADAGGAAITLVQLRQE